MPIKRKTIKRGKTAKRGGGLLWDSLEEKKKKCRDLLASPDAGESTSEPGYWDQRTGGETEKKGLFSGGKGKKARKSRKTKKSRKTRK